MLVLRSPLKSKDICLLTMTLRICAVFVILPFCFVTKYVKLLYCYYLISVIIHFRGMLEICIFAYLYFENEKSTVDIILTIFDLIAYICLIVVGYFNVFRKKQALEELLQNFKKFDLFVETSYFEKTSSIYLTLWLYHAIPVFIMVNKFLHNSFVNSNQFKNFLVSFYIFTLIYIKFLLTLIITVIAKVFISRYNALEYQLKKFFCSLSILIGNKQFKEVDKLRKAFFLLQKNIEMVNDIFGMSIFFIIVNACSGLFSGFSYILLLETAANLESYWKTIQQFAEASVSSTNFLL